MVSDNTEHACLVAEALAVSGGDPAQFEGHLARGLKRWIVGVPAGVGWATLRACGKLCLGVSPSRSGVWSAGNGPAMRSAAIGVACGEDSARLVTLVRIRTRVTHTDPKAEAGALAVAVAASVAHERDCLERFLSQWCGTLMYASPEVRDAASELSRLFEQMAESVRRGQSTDAFADMIGSKGRVSGYIYHTVPVSLHAWLRNSSDVRAAVLEVVRCGGDSDTTGAITGAIAGSGAGRAGIPQDWLDALWEWPRNVEWMTALSADAASAVASGRPFNPPHAAWLLTLSRNTVFAAIVLAHGLRRLLPPY